MSDAIQGANIDDGKAAAPGAGQPATEQKQGTSISSATDSTAQQAAETEADILKAARVAPSPAEEVEHLRRSYAASSTEAKRLKAQHDAISNALKDQGLKPVFKKTGEFVGLEVDGKPGEEPSINFSLDDLSKEDKEALSENPAKAIEAITARLLVKAKKAFARPQPTIDTTIRVEQLSDERVAQAINFVGTKKDEVGQHIFPDFDKRGAMVKSLMQDPSLPEAVQFAISKHPEIMGELFAERLYGAINRRAAAAKAAEAAKQQQTEAGRKAAEVSPAGAGQAFISGPDATKAFRESIAKAGVM